MTRLLPLLLTVALGAAVPAVAQERGSPLADVLNIDAVVTSEVAPDLAVITLAFAREGADVAPLTREVNEALARAFAEARAVPSVIAANGGYSTSPRYDTRGNATTRTGWEVRAEIVLKSKDFNALGVLVGKLSQTMQIAGSNFEISPELRAQESAALVERAARAFENKAAAATRAFGYVGYSIRQVSLGNAGQSGGPRPMAMMDGAMLRSAAPMPVESGRVTLSLTVSGSLQMRR